MASWPDAKWFLIDCSKSGSGFGFKDIVDRGGIGVFTELAKRRLDLKALAAKLKLHPAARGTFSMLWWRSAS